MQHCLDRLAPALVSDDMSVTDRRGDADYVAALGVVSRTFPLASPLVRMYLTHDRAAVREAKAIVTDMAKKAARRAGLHLSFRDLVEVGRMALEYSVSRNCCRCHGTRYELVPGSQCLSTIPCKECGGDGRRTLPKRHRKIITEVVARIERMESSLDGLVVKKL